MNKRASFEAASRRRASVEANVVPYPSRCVQCGICTYNCPIEIDGECVARGPRAVLRFERTALFERIDGRSEK